MDRFIASGIDKVGCKCMTLKSNMDRFIDTHQAYKSYKISL